MKNLNDVVNKQKILFEDSEDDVLELKKKVPDDFDVRDYLTKKGIEFKEHNSSVSGVWLHLQCPFPDHEDKRPSFSINTDSCAWNCYVCGSGSWFDLCERLGWDDWSDDKVLIGTVPISDWKNLKRDLKRKLNKELFIAETPKIKPIYTDDKFYRYLQKRKLEKAITEFDISCCNNFDEHYGNLYKNRVTIPVHSPDGKKILWYEGRSIIDGYKPKYYRPDNVQKTLVLFNYHRVIKSGSRKVIVVEGLTDAIQLWLWGYPVVAIFGASISVEQMEMLMCFDEIYICLDIDKAGIKGFTVLKDLATGSGVKLKRIIIPRGKDANKILKPKFELYYRRAQTVQNSYLLYRDGFIK